MRRVLLVILFALSLSAGLAQQIPSIDSLMKEPAGSNRFDLNALFTMVIANHPVARQAMLLSESARQEIRLAQGSFDPKVQMQYLNKQYAGTEYYQVLNGGVKFPTRLPFDPSIGIEQNRGKYLNPERYISEADNYTQVYAGISVPLGKGLFIDDRRAVLNQATLLKDLNEAEKVKVINKLLLEAAKEYWNWFYAATNYQLILRNKQIAEEIASRVKMSFTFGEVAVIDTVQASTTVQQRTVELQEALVDLANARLTLSTFLWDNAGNPIQLDESWSPVYAPDAVIREQQLVELKDNAMVNHPELQKIDVKLRQLEVDQRLAVENLKPELNLNYYLLNKPLWQAGADRFQPAENYKFGVDFAIPVLLRKERSKLALTKLKIATTSYEQDDLRRRIEVEIDKAYNRLVTIRQIVNAQQQMVTNYERLVEAELINVRQGESDLFKINLQLEKLVQSQSKLLKLRIELEKEKLYLLWAAGARDLTI